MPVLSQLLFSSPALRPSGDRGAFSVIPVDLTQDSQKAVIFHNKDEEILILATELRSEKETRVLEFLPLPSEPAVFRVDKAFLEKVKELVKKKDIQIQESFSKGAGGGTAPVEIKLSQKIGLHDVTVVKINQPTEFENWVKNFFSQKKIKLENKLDDFVAMADDYLHRGFNYFVFDSVTVGKKTRLIEPLAYRFKSKELYYPLKTSNLFGGTGQVDLILILPGSFWVDEIKMVESRLDYLEVLFRRDWEISSSSKMYPEEIAALLPEAGGLFKPGQKIYLQMLSYFGSYDFKDDLIWDVSGLPRYAYKIRMETSYGMNYVQKMSPDEMKDFLQAKCEEDPQFLKEKRMYLDDDLLGFLLTSGYSCQDFVHPEEFRVYAAVFNPAKLSSVRLDGLPEGWVTLEDQTTNRLAEKIKGVDKELLEDYNSKNKKKYNLGEFLPEGFENLISIRRSESGQGQSLTGVSSETISLSSGKTYVSRVGFNKSRTAALVFVSHVAGPEMGVGYLVLLEKNQGVWNPVRILSSQIY
ncbi:MAG: hypothetical protein ACUVRL_11070 [Candidatus Saccharicenans sp.]